MKRYTANKFIAAASHALCNVLSPLMMPTYGVFLVLWVSVLCVLPYGTRASALLMCMGITCILPLIFISVLRHFKVIKGLHIEVRQQRLYPYLITAVCHLVAAYYLYFCHSPQWFIMFMVGSAVTVLVLTVINLKWKISAYMAGIGGVVGLVYSIHVLGLNALDMLWPLCLTVLVGGILGSALLALKRHDIWQLLAGAVVGFLVVSLTMRFFG